MSSGFACEIRQLRGVPVVLPDETDYLIRARFGAGMLPDSFKTVRAEVALRLAASVVSETDEPGDRIEPKEGIPTRAVGAVLERLSGQRLLLDVGFPVEIDMPEGIGAASFGLGIRVTCDLIDEPSVTSCRLE